MGRGFEGQLTIGSDIDPAAEPFERALRHQPVGFVVFDHQDAAASQRRGKRRGKGCAGWWSRRRRGRRERRGFSGGPRQRLPGRRCFRRVRLAALFLVKETEVEQFAEQVEEGLTAERFGEHVIETGGEHAATVVFKGGGGDGQDYGAPAQLGFGLANPPDGAITVEHGHADVHQDQVRTPGRPHLDRLLSVRYRPGFEPKRSQEAQQEIAVFRGVVGDQDFRQRLVGQKAHDTAAAGRLFAE